MSVSRGKIKRLVPDVFFHASGSVMHLSFGGSARLGFLGFAIFGLTMPSVAKAQIGRAPSTGTHSSSSSALVPDSGVALMSRNPRAAWNSTLAGNQLSGAAHRQGYLQLPGTSVQVGVIDLDRLDQAILNSVADPVPGRLRRPAPVTASSKDAAANRGKKSSGTSRSTSGAKSFQDARSVGRNPSAARDADTVSRLVRRAQLPTEAEQPLTQGFRPSGERPSDYAYMALLNHANSHHLVDTPRESPLDEAAEIRFWLEKAKESAARGHMAAAQVFYETAWTRLPESKRTAIAKQLEASQKEKGDRRP
jgi:hypothetical protein